MKNMKRMWLLIGLICLMGSARAAVNITETISTNEPTPYTMQGSSQVLYACAYTYTLNLNVTGTCGSTITATLPSGISFFATGSGGVTVTSGATDNPVTFTVSAPGSVHLEIIDACNISQNYTSTPIIYSGLCTVNPTPVSYIVRTPVMMIDNYTTTYDGVAVTGPSPIGLYKRRATTQLVREYDIKLTEGKLKQFSLDYTPEMEFGPVTLTISVSGGGTLTPYPGITGPTNIPINSTQLQTLFVTRDYMMINDLIHVVESTNIVQCSNMTAADNTTYTLNSICTDGCTTCGCHSVTTTNSIFVNPNHSNLGVSHTINGAASSTQPIDVCGVTPFDFELRFTNPAPIATNVANSNIKKITSLRIPIDLDAFDIATAGVVNWNRVMIVYGGIPISIAALQSGGFITSGFYNYNATVPQVEFTLNSTTMTAGILTAWGGTSPFLEWYAAGEYNDMRENAFFTVVFDNLLYQYNDVLTLNAPHVGLDDCHGGLYYALFSDTYYNTFAQYFNQCDDMTGTPFSLNVPEYFNYKNSYPVTGFAEASAADVISTPVDIDFYFTGPTGGDPWALSYPAAGGNTIVFNCVDNIYRVSITMPDDLVITAGSTIYYWTSAGGMGTGTAAAITPPAPSNAGGLNTYTFNLVDMGGNPIHNPNGRLLVSIFMAPGCVPTTSGLADVNIRIENVCNNNCPNNVVTVACFGTQLFWRCNGPCCGPPANTSSFTFERSTPGFEPANHAVPVTLNGATHKLHRAYPCDHIQIHAVGTVVPAGGTCPGGGAIPDADVIRFRINYTSPVNFQFFEFVSGSFFSTPTGTVVLGGGNFIETPLGGNAFQLDFEIGNAATANLLQGGGTVALTLDAVLRVKDMATTPAPGFYLNPQIRGQFVSIMSPVYTEESCDDYGAGMTIINVQTANSVSIAGPGFGDQSQGYPWYVSECRRIFQVLSQVNGGITGLDEFPNEFRPITTWPTTGAANKISITFPANFNVGTINNLNFMPRRWGPYTAVQSSTLLQTVTFIGQNSTDFPVLEHDGNVIRMSIIGDIQNNCPNETSPPELAAYSFPNVRRAFAVDEPVCMDPNILAGNATVPLSNYNLDMNYGAGALDVSSNHGFIDGVQMIYTSASFSPNIQHVWVRNVSPNMIINSIGICTLAAVPAYVTATQVGGYFQLPPVSFANGQVYALRIEYTLTNCQTNVMFPMELDYSFYCPDYPPPAANNCGVNHFTLDLNPLPSSMSMSFVGSTGDVSNACNEFSYTFDLNSLLDGNVENLTFTANLPAGLTVVGASYDYTNSTGNYTGPMPTFSTAGQDYTWDLNSNIVPSPVSLNNADQLLVTITFTGDCSVYGNSIPLYFEANGTDICTDVLPNVNSTYNTNIVFPPMDPSTNTCNCSGCEDFVLSYNTQDNCKFDFEAILPAGNTCSNYVINWDFGDGNTASGNTVSHTYLTNSGYQVCYDFTCLDDNTTCHVCQWVYTDCGDPGDPSDKLCKRIYNQNYADIGEAVIPTPDGGCAIAGTIFDSQSGDSQMYFAKYDNVLNQATAWGRRLGGDYKDRGYSVVYRKDDGYYIAGTVDVSDTDKDIFVVKLDEQGNQLWSYRYGYDNKKIDEARKIIDMSEGHDIALLVVGFTNSVSDRMNVLAMKIKTDGSIVNVNTYGSSNDDLANHYGNDVVKSENGPDKNVYYITGERSLNGSDVLAIKIDQSLNQLASTYIKNDSHNEIGNGITINNVASGQPEVYIVGSISDSHSSLTDIYVVKLDENLAAGASPNSLVMGLNTVNERAWKVKMTSDRELIIAAESYKNTYMHDALLVKVNPATMTPDWAKSTTVVDNFEIYKDVAQIERDYYVAIGNYAITAVDRDIFVTKATSEGISCCIVPYEHKTSKILQLKDNMKDKKVEYKTKEYGYPKDYYIEQLICPFDHEPRLSGSSMAEQEISVFPNPSTGEITLTVPGTEGADVVVEIRDMIGKSVMNKSIKTTKENTFMLNIGDLYNGVYLISVSQGDQNWIGKITLQK